MKALILALVFSAALLSTAAMHHGPKIASGGGAPAGITQDADTQNTQNSGDPSFNHAQGALTNGEATVIVMWAANTSTAVSATYGGASMANAEGDVNSVYHVDIFKLDLGTSGAGTKAVAVTFNGSVYYSHVEVVTHSGVKQGATWVADGNADYGTAVSVPIATTAVSELVIAAACTGASSTTITEGKTLYHEWEASMDTSAEHTAGTGSSVTMDWTLSTAQNWVCSVVVLQAAP